MRGTEVLGKREDYREPKGRRKKGEEWDVRWEGTSIRHEVNSGRSGTQGEKKAAGGVVKGAWSSKLLTQKQLLI